MIFLNLFLAILLDNFEVEDEEEEDPNQMSMMMKFHEFKASLFEKISSKFNEILWKMHQKKLTKMKQQEGSQMNSSYKRNEKMMLGGEGAESFGAKRNDDLDQGFQLHMIKTS